MSEFGFSSTANDVLEDKDLTGKTVFITGGASGLGQEAARALAARGAKVVIAARNQAKLDAAAEEICSGASGSVVETIAVDLASLDSVRQCGEETNRRFAKIDLLINNAGVMACPLAHTEDGFEMQFGTNHLGHFLLTKKLMPLVKNGADKRIVNLSSRGHHIAPVDLDDPNFQNREYNKWQSYGQSKTANILFSVGLEKRFADQGIHAYALHPGGIETNLGRHLTDEDREFLRDRMEQIAKAGGETWKTIPQGAATTCWVATADELEGQGGVYCEDCNVAAQDDENPLGGVRSYALDQGNADRLWTLSEEMVGENFAPDLA